MRVKIEAEAELAKASGWDNYSKRRVCVVTSVGEHDTPRAMDTEVFGRAWLPKSWCTPIEEPIERGTPVFAWMSNEAHRYMGFYAEHVGEAHYVSRCQNAGGMDCFDHVRPITADDLGGEK